MADIAPAAGGIIVHPAYGTLFKVDADGFLNGATLQSVDAGGAAGSRLPGGASQNPHPDRVDEPANLLRSVSQFALDPSMLEENTQTELIWVSAHHGQLCVLHRHTGQACFLSTFNHVASLSDHETSEPPIAEPAGQASALWGAAGWIGGLFGASEPQYAESDWLPPLAPPASLARADVIDCQRHTSVTQAATSIPPLQAPPLHFKLLATLRHGSFPGAPPGASLHAVFPAAPGSASWDALCVMSVQQHGVEKAGLLYGLLSTALGSPVPLGAVPFPASTITQVQLTRHLAVCVVQTSDTDSSTAGLTTPLKANGTLCSSWSEQPALQGVQHMVAATGASGQQLVLVSYHCSSQVACFTHSTDAHCTELQRAWDTALPGEVGRLELGAPLDPPAAAPPAANCPAGAALGTGAAQESQQHNIKGPRARNPLQRRGGRIGGPGGAGGGGTSDSDPFAPRHQHAWVQCADQVLWLDLTCGLWLRVPGISAQQQVLTLGQSHALVATHPLPGHTMATVEADSDEELEAELQLLALPRPALVCRSGAASVPHTDGAPGRIECLSLGLPSPSTEAFFIPGAVILLPPVDMAASIHTLQPAVLTLNRGHWGQVGSLRSLHVSAGSCFHGEQHDNWRLLVLQGSSGALVSAFRWHVAGCTHLPWQRVLPSPGRQLLEARIVDDRCVHVLSSGSSDAGQLHAHVTVFQAIMMYAAGDSGEGGPPSSQPSGLELHASEAWSTPLPQGSTAHLSEVAVLQQAPSRAALHAAVMTSHGNRHMLLREASTHVPAMRVVCDKPVTHTQRIAGVVVQEGTAGVTDSMCIGACISRDSPVMLVHSGTDSGALLCRLKMQAASSAGLQPATHNSHAEQRLAISALQLSARGQHQVLQQTLQHSQLPAGGYLHAFGGGRLPLQCSMSLSAGQQMSTTHGVLVALACVKGFQHCLLGATDTLQKVSRLAVVPLVAQQLELALVHAYLLQDAHPGCVHAMVGCLSNLLLEDALATVVVTARKGEVSELTQWNKVAGHPLLLWAASVQCLVAGIADIALHIERVKQLLHSQVRAGLSEAPTAAQHAAASQELQNCTTPIAARASLAAYAATQCLMLVQETYLMRAGSQDTSQQTLGDLPWRSEPTAADEELLSKAKELAQAMLIQLGAPSTSASAEGGDGAFWVMQLVVACTTRTGVEVQRLLQLLEPVLPRAARAALGDASSLDEVSPSVLSHLSAHVQRLLLFVSSLRGLQEQVRAFTARMLRSRDSVAKVQ